MYFYADIFFDQYRNVIVIPGTKKRSNHWRTDLNRPQAIDFPYSVDDLGKRVRLAIQDAIAYPEISDEEVVAVWTEVTGIKSWARFARQRHMVDVRFNDVEGFVLLYRRRDNKSGAFGGSVGDPEFTITVPTGAPDAELGQAALDVFCQGIAHYEPDFVKEVEDTPVPAPAQPDQQAGAGDKPVPFGYKNAWIALSASSPEEATVALGLKVVQAATWEVGLEMADKDGMFFVSPTLDGWVLIVGAGEMKLESLSTLATRAKHVQYFLTHRVVDYHAWARFESGSLIRAYSYIGESGEVIWDEGVLTKEEADLGLTSLQKKEDSGSEDNTWLDIVTWPNEDHVIELAALWSIDTLFRTNDFPPALGLLCKY